MKIRVLIWLGILIQSGFLIFTCFTAPEPAGYLNIAIQELQSSNRSVTVVTEISDRLIAIKGSFGLIVRICLFGNLVNVIVLVCALRLSGGKPSVNVKKAIDKNAWFKEQ
jgi:hypothetical protein